MMAWVSSMLVLTLCRPVALRASGLPDQKARTPLTHSIARKHGRPHRAVVQGLEVSRGDIFQYQLVQTQLSYKTFQLRVLLLQFFQPLRLVYLQPPIPLAPTKQRPLHDLLFLCMPARSSCRSPQLPRSVAAGSLPAPADTSCLVPFQAPLMPVSYVLNWHKRCRALHSRAGATFGRITVPEFLCEYRLLVLPM